MHLITCRLVMATMVVVALGALVSAQITFSRDWTGGKRAAPPDLPLDCTQFTRLCRHFIHELKAAMSAETSGGSGKRRRADELAPLYDDDK